MRCAVALLRPWALAMVRVLQWVAPGGLVWVVACTPVGSIGHPPAPAGCDLGEGTRAALQETLAPEDHGETTDAHLLSDPAVGQAIGGEEGDPSPEGDSLGSVQGTDPGFQRSALLGRYWEGIS